MGSIQVGELADVQASPMEPSQPLPNPLKQIESLAKRFSLLADQLKIWCECLKKMLCIRW